MVSYEGYGSRLEVQPEQVSIVRGAISGVLTEGVVVPVRSIVGANFKPANLLKNGHLQIVAAGVLTAKPSASDRFTVVFTRSQEKPFAELHAWLLQIGSWNAQQGGAIAPPAMAPRTTPSAASATAALTPPVTPSPHVVQGPQASRPWAGSPKVEPTPAPAASASRSSRASRKSGVRRVLLTRVPAGRPASEQLYTALDLETTGLDPKVDRIVEIGLVKFDGTGRTMDEFTTLVNNPGSSREARDVHRIDDADLTSAPNLETVLPEVLAFLDGTVLVAHNLDFDQAFLTAALNRHRIPIPDIPAVCTLQTCRRQLEGPGFSLAAMHKTATGQWAEGRHTALGDARANKIVLMWLLQQAPSLLHVTGGPDGPSGATHTSRLAHISCRPVPLLKASMTDLLAAFPQSSTARAGDPLELQHYQQLLTESVEDARLTFDEAEALTRQARLTRVTGTQLRDLHRQAWYDTFQPDTTADWAQLPPTRRREMYRLADGLGLTDLAEPLARIIEDNAEPPPRLEQRYLRGLRVGFAGDDAQIVALRQRALEHGAAIATNITVSVQWLASSTPYLDDRRHAAARGLGVPIVTTEAASERIEEALRAAGMAAFERQLQLDEQAARIRQRAAEQDAYWRPTWRSTQLEKDPELDYDVE